MKINETELREIFIDIYKGQKENNDEAIERILLLFGRSENKPMDDDYPLIPMSEIEDEARLIAVRWHENATNWIGDKHKLASDIMNYARRKSNTSTSHEKQRKTQAP